jgi:hypothetical protein
VSTAAKPFGRPMDPGWRNFTARMIAKSEATVVRSISTATIRASSR